MMQLIRNKVAVIRILALGVLLALMAAVMMLMAKPAHASTTFTLNSTGDENEERNGSHWIFHSSSDLSISGGTTESTSESTPL